MAIWQAALIPDTWRRQSTLQPQPPFQCLLTGYFLIQNRLIEDHSRCLATGRRKYGQPACVNLKNGTLVYMGGIHSSVLANVPCRSPLFLNAGMGSLKRNGGPVKLFESPSKIRYGEVWPVKKGSMMSILSTITNEIDGKTYWISTIDTVKNIRLNGAMPESLALALTAEFQAAVFNQSFGLLTRPVLTLNFWGSDLRKWQMDEFHQSVCTMVASESVHDLTDTGNSPATFARYGFMADVEQYRLLWGLQPLTYVFLMESQIIPA